MSTLKDELQARVGKYDRWATRRQFGADGPNMRRLWILTCMDERLPVDEALGIRADSPVGGGDAHLFRNAGGIVTDDAIRSAMLTINFFGTKGPHAVAPHYGAKRARGDCQCQRRQHRS